MTTNEKWPTLKHRDFVELEIAGIMSCDELIDAIKKYGIQKHSDGSYSIRHSDIHIRNAGKIRWQRYIAMLEFVGFDWKQYDAPARKRGNTVTPSIRLDIEIYEQFGEGHWAQARYLVHSHDDALWTDSIEAALEFLRTDLWRLNKKQPNQ